MNARAKRMTLQEVAQRVGVSTPTISKVLNGRSDVAPATRERVLRVLREQQYLPRGASTLPMADQHIELAFDALTNPNNLAIMRGVLHAAAQQSGHVALSTVPEHVTLPQWVNELERVGRLGLILVSSRLSPKHHTLLQEAALPLVLIDPRNPVSPTLPSVGTTNWQAGMSAVQHLLELGHRRIAMLRGYECLVDDARYHGYLAALSGYGIAVDDRLVARGDFRFEPSVTVAAEILALPDPPTAFFAANDIQALGVMEAARRIGMTLPDDLSVVGFDDSLYATSTWPQLTTVRQPFVQMGEVACQLLHDRIDGRDAAAVRVELAATLIIRDSTAPPRARDGASVAARVPLAVPTGSG